jgi:plasmid stabilization system protein ParE
MRRRIVERAQRQLNRLLEWWSENRTAAPEVLIDELERTLQLIAERPGVGAPWPTPSRSGLRRVLMTHCRYHVYYWVDVDEDTVVIAAVWGATRGRGPAL